MLVGGLGLNYLPGLESEVPTTGHPHGESIVSVRADFLSACIRGCIRTEHDQRVVQTCAVAFFDGIEAIEQVSPAVGIPAVPPLVIRE